MKKKQQFLRFFTRALCSLLGATIPLLKSLQSLAKQQEQPWERELILRLAQKISAGYSLSYAMGKEPKIFPKFMVGLVLVGEETGTLVKSLEKVAEFVEENANLQLKMYSLLTYPLFLFGATLAGTLLLVKIFVPAFLPIFKEMHASLPFPTHLLIWISNFLSSPFALFSLFIFVALFFFFYHLSRKNDLLRKSLEKWLFSIPFIGSVIKKGMMAQITSTLAIAYSVGLPLGKGLELLVEVIENETLCQFIQDGRLALAQGETLSSFFLANSQHVPPLIGHMMTVAEATGKVDVLMIKCTKLLEEEMDYLIQSFTKFLEPGILIFLGMVVSFIMISVFLPLYGMLGSVQ